VIPDLQAALVCEDVRLEVNGFNTIVGVVNMIAVPVIPFRIIKFCVFTRWVSGEGNFIQTVRILRPDDEHEVAKTETHFEMTGGDAHTTNITLFGGLEFQQFGDYPIEILLDGDLFLRFSLRVVPVRSQS
jgi:hypothetical protein